MVALRIEHAAPEDLAVVRRQLGPIEPGPATEPDIVISFHDRVPDGDARLIGLRDAAATADRFLLLRGRWNSAARVALDARAFPITLDVERGLVAIPQLVGLVGLAAARHDAVMLHASAVVADGRGVLVTGWSKGGKTEIVLGLMDRPGVRFLGDEWIFVRAGGELTGLPEPIRLWDWQLREVAAARARLRRGERLRLLATRAGAGGVARLAGALPGGPGRFLRRVSAVAERQLDVQVPPRRLFGEDRIVSRAPLAVALLVEGWTGSDYRVERLDGHDLAARAMASLDHERLELRAIDAKLRFAFPDRPGLPFPADGVELARLASLFSSVPAWRVLHPMPFSIERLTATVAPLLPPGI